MKSVFIGMLLIFASVWSWAEFSLIKQIDDDRAFQNESVDPSIKKALKNSTEFQQALKSREQGKMVPLPKLEPIDTQPIQESIDRMKRRNELFNIRSLGELGLFGTAFAWIIATLIQTQIYRRRWEAAERPAIPNAGKIINELVHSKSVFVAKSVKSTPEEIQIDGSQSVVVFCNLSFVAAFVGNPVLSRVELQFSELLAGSVINAGRGKRGLRLRTTRGAVVITDSVQPFEKLVELLLDISEKNRTAPELYRLTLSREPVVRTPWYGWLLIAAAVGGVVALIWWIL